MAKLVFYLLVVSLFCVACKQADVDQLRFATAALRGDTDLVRELLKKRTVDINAVNGEFGPAIASAAYGGHGEIVQLLLDNGADINVRDKKGTTALMNAIVGDKPEIVSLLLKNGADVSVELSEKDLNNKPITALTFARIKGNRAIIRMLEENADRQAGSNDK